MSFRNCRYFSVGETVNLMSIDSARFNNIIFYINTLWNAPLIIGLSLYFLWQQLGWCCMSGLAFMALLTPFNTFLAKMMKKHQV